MGFQQYYNFLVTISLIDRGNRSTVTKPPTCRKSLTLLSQKVVSTTHTHVP